MADRNPERPEEDLVEESNNDGFPDEVAPDVPEADALEQARGADEAPRRVKPAIPIDVNEADALEQAQEVSGGDEERR